MIRKPSFLERFRLILRHSSRILFNKWPGYNFDDLATIQDCADGPAFRSAAKKMSLDPEGQAILRQRPRLSMKDVDWKRLQQLPTDTLGYNFWHHFHANGLMEEIVLGSSPVQWDEQTEYAKDRYRQTHDCRHVLVGLGVSGSDEVVLQTFQFAQLPQKLSAAIVLLGGLKHALIDREFFRLVRNVPRAWRAGKRAVFLSNLPYEALWELPLNSVRVRYGIQPVGNAYPVRHRHPEALPVAQKSIQTATAAARQSGNAGLASKSVRSAVTSSSVSLHGRFESNFGSSSPSFAQANS